MNIKQTLKKIKMSKDTKAAFETLLCILVIVSIVTCGLAIKVVNNSVSESEKIDRKFSATSANKVGIHFNTEITSEKDYNTLRISCNDYIESTKEVESDAIVSVQVTVPEEQFADEGVGSPDEEYDYENELIKYNLFNLSAAISSYNPYSNKATYVETGPVYFDDMLLLRYVNDKGELKVILSKFTDISKKDTQILKQSEISQYFIGANANTSVNTNIIPTTNPSREIMTEAAYINNVAGCIIEMIQADTDEGLKAAMVKALSYFTTEGKDSVVACRDELSITPESSIKLIVGLAGKSETSVEIKDRLYLQYEVNNNGEISYVNIIVKMNSISRIFDIDVI